MNAKIMIGGLALLGLVALNQNARADEAVATAAAPAQESMPTMFINVDTKQVVQVDANGTATPVNQETLQSLSQKWHAPDEEANDGSTKADTYMAQTVAFRGIGGGIDLGPIGVGVGAGRGGLGGGFHLGPIGVGVGAGRGGIGGHAHVGPVGAGGGFYRGGRWHRRHYYRRGYYAGEWAPYAACNNVTNSEFCF